ncbi:MAG: hypothetical protein QGG54_11350, partial [Gammaproteobacteria bacterium]|nr:hypothetical protein [Gammaproteobacteria bacterium]
MLQKKSLIVIVIVIVNMLMIWPSFAIGAPDTGEQARPVSFDTGSEPLTLARAVELSLTNNQSLAGLQARAEALGAVPTQAGALPDPTLGL